MHYHFDFGDDWHFSIILEAVNPPNLKIKGPTILKSHGEAPLQYALSDEYNDGEWDDDLY